MPRAEQPRNNSQWIELAQAVQLGNYRPAPMVLREGRGCRVTDVEGHSFLDLSGGIAVLSVGHAHPRLAAAIAEQAARLMHVSNLFYNDRAIELAAEIARRTPFDRVYFANSGAEANESLLKLARRWHYGRGATERVEFVATEGSFHGRSYGALSITGQAKYHEGMGPLLPGVKRVPFDDLAAMRVAVNERTAAVIVEPIQAEGGLVVPQDGYLAGLRQICDQAGALLLFDEVQTGYGRTGRFTASEWSGVVPDACSFAKGIAGGFPLGAMAVREAMADGLPPGSHASTFGGNPLACAAGLAVLAIFDAEGLVDRAQARGRYLRERLRALAADDRIPTEREVRGQGLLQGIALRSHVDPVATLAALREAGLLLSIAGGHVIRISPPLIVADAELDEGVGILERVLRTAPSKEAA